MLVLTNDEIEQMLSMDECLSVLEEMYLDIAKDQALSLPRVDNIVPCGYDKAYYAFKHMGGALPRHKLIALRLNSDIITHPLVRNNLRRVKVPLADGCWVGLVAIFSTETGELLSIFPDGVAQRMRVGATNGLGIKYLARKDSSCAGLLGSGWQAGAQIYALLSVLPIKKVKVFSSQKEKRESFAAEMSSKTGANIYAVDSPEECVRDVDIILSATSSIVPVIRPEWLLEGITVSCIKLNEVNKEVLDVCNQVVIHTRLQSKQENNILPGTKHIPQEHKKGWWNEDGVEWDEYPELSDLVVGQKRGRTSERDITCFINNMGLGLQFTALGALILEKARGYGLGKELPAEWFRENVHP